MGQLPVSDYLIKTISALIVAMGEFRVFQDFLYWYRRIDLFYILFFGSMLVAVGGVALLGWIDQQRPVIELRKDHWTCSRTERRSHLQPMVVGKATVLMPMNIDVCTEYTHLTK